MFRDRVPSTRREDPISERRGSGISIGVNCWIINGTGKEKEAWRCDSVENR